MNRSTVWAFFLNSRGETSVYLIFRRNNWEINEIFMNFFLTVVCSGSFCTVFESNLQAINFIWFCSCVPYWSVLWCNVLICADVGSSVPVESADLSVLYKTLDLQTIVQEMLQNYSMLLCCWVQQYCLMEASDWISAHWGVAKP